MKHIAFIVFALMPAFIFAMDSGVGESNVKLVDQKRQGPHDSAPNSGVALLEKFVRQRKDALSGQGNTPPVSTITDKRTDPTIVECNDEYMQILFGEEVAVRGLRRQKPCDNLAKLTDDK